MGRFYSLTFSGVAVSAAIDAFEALAAATKPFALHEVVLSQESDYGDAAAEGLRVTIKRASGGYTSGSGGSTPTPAPHHFYDAAAGGTYETCNTTQATAGSGALTVLRVEAFNIQGGYQYLPTPETRPVFGISQACVVSLTAPADAITLSGTLVFEELT